MEVIEIVNFELIDSFFLRKLRKSKGDSADKICNDLNINRTYLYSVENGEKRLSEDLLNKILSYYHVQYNKDENLYYQAYDLLIKAFEVFVFKNDELLKEYLSQYEERKEIFEYSRAFILNGLIEATLTLLTKRINAKECIDNCKQYLFIYDDNTACIYAVIYGFATGIYLNVEDTKRVIVDVYQNHPMHNLIPCVKGMFVYQLGSLKFEERRYIEAIRFFEDSITSLQAGFCVERVIQTKVQIASCYIYLHLFNDAEQTLLRLLEEAEKYNYLRRMKTCLDNLAYIYFVTRQYVKCEQYVYKAKEVGSTFDDIDYYLAYCAYKTKSKAEARSVISKLMETKHDRYTSRMLLMIKGFVNDNTELIDKYYLLLKSYMIEIHEYLDLSALYEMNISYYMEHDRDKCLKLVNEYINCKEI